MNNCWRDRKEQDHTLLLFLLFFLHLDVCGIHIPFFDSLWSLVETVLALVSFSFYRKKKEEYIFKFQILLSNNCQQTILIYRPIQQDLMPDQGGLLPSTSYLFFFFSFCEIILLSTKSLADEESIVIRSEDQGYEWKKGFQFLFLPFGNNNNNKRNCELTIGVLKFYFK